MIEDSTRNIVLRDLGDGLILRHGNPQDAEELATFNGFIFRNHETQEPFQGTIAWTYDLMSGHPSVSPRDFTVVEDTHTGKIVSSFVWISQRWCYGGIEFGVGRPEMVGTHPDYRNRGVVRAQFDVAHEWSAQRGECIQVITGIPYFYRQFGYEMTIELGAGRSGDRSRVPMLKKDETEPYRIRAVASGDIPFISRLYAQRAHRYLVDCVRDEVTWRYELSGKCEKNMTRMEFRVIETLAGEAIGVLAHAPSAGRAINAYLYELEPGISWVSVTPSVIRYLWATGMAYTERDKKDTVSEFRLELGEEHPVYSAMKDHLPNKEHPYAWYVRVPDVAGFLRHIAPALEQQLAASVLPGYTGELKLSFYRSGLRLVFERGRITTVESCKLTPADGINAAFPNLTFLQLLFGYRSLEELRYAFPDCWAEGNATRALLEALFPKHDSAIWPIA